jgi:hypothetical protein
MVKIFEKLIFGGLHEKHRQGDKEEVILTLWN